MSRQVFRTVYTPVGTDNPTQQHFKDQCTVSKIVKRFQTTGIIASNSREPLYGDFSQATDLHTAMNLVIEAETSFMALDAHIRAAADNDPQKFLEMLATDEGCEKLRAEGLELTDPKSETAVPAEKNSEQEPPGDDPEIGTTDQ